MLLRSFANHDVELGAIQGHRKFWYHAGMVNVAIWVIIVPIYLFFFSYSFHGEQASANEEATLEEALSHEMTSDKTIETLNRKVVKDEEIAREVKIQEAREKSKDQFETLMNQALEGKQ